MEITRLNHSCFRIKGKKAIVLIEPTREIKNLTAHIVIKNGSRSEVKVKGEPVVIFGPGEYEIRGVRILGIREKGVMAYKIEMDDFFLLYLSRLKEKLSEEKIEALNQVDILFLSTGEPKAASTLTSQLEPFVVIPIGEKGVEDFLKEEGMEEAEVLHKLIISKGKLPEERRIIVLK